jgi:hypothetical protein
MHNLHRRHLGKRKPRRDCRTLHLANYLSVAALPPVPLAHAWSVQVKAPWPMMLNDNLGDCTIAAAGHMEQCWDACAALSAGIISDAQILAAYEAAAGYNPADPNSDQGAAELDVLNYWRRRGIGGHKIAAYAAVEPTNQLHVRAGCYLFGGLYIGLDLPESAQAQTLWDVLPGGAHGLGQPGSWGGHAVPILDYDAAGLVCVTWAQLQRMTWAFFTTYCDEAYAVLSSQDWFHQGRAPMGLDLKSLQADLALVSH